MRHGECGQRSSDGAIIRTIGPRPVSADIGLVRSLTHMELMRATGRRRNW